MNNGVADMEVAVRIEQFLRRTGVPPTRFGRVVLNDPRLVRELRNGRQLRPRTAARIAAWLDAAEPRR